MTLEWAMALAALAVALLFRPWQTLRHQGLQNPWLTAMLILPWVWWTKNLLPTNLPLHISGACLLVLMFGWPLAIVSLLPIVLGAALIDVLGRVHGQSLDWSHAWDLLSGQVDAIVAQTVWMGMLPATLSLALGLSMRRYMPRHLFVFILGRGFFGTVLAMTLSAVLAALAGRVPAESSTEDWLLAHWLLAWGEAFATGMFTAIFVAFKPHWLLTYTDERYLPPSAAQK
ncbi:MAG: energy-coupling factor ABC transporter permease [Burkholderiales bacterium]|nr:energy-coupling factor ABC transporter permease [Burkholderiales bacterium]